MTLPAHRGAVVLGVVGLMAASFALIRPRGAPGAAPTPAPTAAAARSAPSPGGFSFGGGDGKRVEVLAPRRGPIARTIEAPGTVQAGSEAGIGAPFDGRIVELVKDTGDRVEKDDVLFRLDPTEHAERVLEAQLDRQRKRIELEQAQRRHVDAEKEPSDLTEARLKVRQSELESQRATAQLESAASRRDRSKQMLERGIGTSIDLEAAMNEHRVAEIGVRLAQEQLELARETLTFRERTWADARATAGKDLARAEADVRGADVALTRARRDLERTEVKTPLAGVVTGRGVNLGDEVTRATGSTTHYIVSDLEHLLVYCDVDEGDVGQVARGQPATARVGALGDEVRLRAAVYDVAMRAETKSGAEVPTFRVRVLLEPGQPRIDELRPGMTATVVIETAREEAALKVPIQAVLQRELREVPEAVQKAAPPALLEGKRPFDLVDLVFVVDGGVARARIVERGLQDDDEVALVAGAPADDAQVVVGPFRALEKLGDGDAVRGEPAELPLPPDEPATARAAVAAVDTASR